MLFPVEAARITDVWERKQWHLDYITSLLNKDLKDIGNIKRQDILFDLVKILAGWSSKYMDAAKIGTHLNITKITLDSYINALEQMFIYERVAPWTKTDYEYAGKKAKFYAADTGMMASALHWYRDEVLGDAEITNSDRAGKLMETFVFQELAAQIDIGRGEYTLCQYRDYKKHEIDFIIERSDGAIAAVEVKASSSVVIKDFAPQKWFRENIIKNKVPYHGIVLYTGQDTLSFGDGMYAVPAAALWT